jgi:hypothetical protein
LSLPILDPLSAWHLGPFSTPLDSQGLHVTTGRPEKRQIMCAGLCELLHELTTAVI